MRPRRTVESNQVFTLPGGNEDSDLWTHFGRNQAGLAVICSVWVPSDEERAAITAGDNIELVIWGTVQPPVAVVTTDVQLGKPTPPSSDPQTDPKGNTDE